METGWQNTKTLALIAGCPLPFLFCAFLHSASPFCACHAGFFLQRCCLLRFRLVFSCLNSFANETVLENPWDFFSFPKIYFIKSRKISTRRVFSTVTLFIYLQGFEGQRDQGAPVGDIFKSLFLANTVSERGTVSLFFSINDLGIEIPILASSSWQKKGDGKQVNGRLITCSLASHFSAFFFWVFKESASSATILCVHISQKQSFSSVSITLYLRIPLPSL